MLCEQAQAGPITGDIDFAGSVTFNTNSLATATQVTTFNTAIVVGSTGSFTSVANFSAVTFAQPYVFNSGAPGAPLPGPAYTPLWTVGGFSFNLITSNVVLQNGNDLIVSGFGTLTDSDGHVTNGVWRFSSNKADGSTSPTFSFASNTSAVPEGGSALALLGIGLVVAEVLRRKFAVA